MIYLHDSESFICGVFLSDLSLSFVVLMVETSWQQRPLSKFSVPIRLFDLSGSITTSPNSELETLHSSSSSSAHRGGRSADRCESKSVTGGSRRRAAVVTSIMIAGETNFRGRVTRSSLETRFHLFYWLILMDLMVFWVFSAQTPTCLPWTAECELMILMIFVVSSFTSLWCFPPRPLIQWVGPWSSYLLLLSELTFIFLSSS